MDVRKVGVEEELMLVDPATGCLTAVGADAVRAGAWEDDGSPPVEAELFLQQFETQTPPVTDLDDLDRALRRGRRALGEAAAAAGAAAVAVAVPVLADHRADDDATVTPEPRYRRIHEVYGELARSSLASAMHLHVDVTEEEGVRVLDHLGPWLPVLLAVSTNSPFVHGRDTGYASWRSQLWARWPSHGTGEAFGSPEAYAEVTDRLVSWGAALDDAMVYFDARVARDYPTVEIRVADVCTDVDDAVLVAALGRALVATAATQDGPAGWRSELLRAASWRASRHGLADRLVDPATAELAEPRTVLASLVAHVRPALEEAGDVDLVEHHVERLLASGTGAVHQRRAFERHGTPEAVVADLVRRTEQGWSPA